MPRPSGVPGVLRAHPPATGVAISALLSVVYLIWEPQTLDLAAQTYRADLFSSDGWVIWSPDWYGGFTVPGYSLLYPPLGSLFGPALLGALSAVAAAALFGAIALRAFVDRAWLGIAWFGLASVVAIYGGRITFALGLALGLATVLAIQRDRRLLAGAGGIATAAASPVAGLFALLAAAAVIAAALWRRRASPPATVGLPVSAALAAALGAALTLAALGLAFPTEGHQPFVFSAFVPIPLAVAAIWLWTGAEDDLIRIGSLLYLALALAAVIAETPLGGNAVRLGGTFAGPLLALLLVRRRPWVLALVAIPLLYWQWTATVRDVAAAEGDPSTEAPYYEPVLGELADRGVGGLDRVHVVATRNRWESVYVAEQVPIDGGWLRQLETVDGYALTGAAAEDYVGRLRARGVSYLAVSDAEPDRSAEAELELIESGALPLEPVFESAHWRLYELVGPGAPAAHSELTAIGPDRFSVHLGPDGSAEPALRYSAYFEVTGGAGCVSERGRRTLITGEANATVTVEARLDSAALLGRDSSCSG